MLNRLSGGLIVLLFYSAAFGSGLPGNFDGFDMKTCGAKKCLQIKAGKVATGMLDGGFASNHADLVISSKIGAAGKVILTSRDLFFNFTDSKVMIRDIVGQPNTEALYDLKSEELQFFKVSGITKN